MVPPFELIQSNDGPQLWYYLHSYSMLLTTCYPFVLFSQHDAAVGLDGDLGAPLLIHLQCGLGGLSLLIIHKVVQRLACHHG